MVLIANILSFPEVRKRHFMACGKRGFLALRARSAPCAQTAPQQRSVLLNNENLGMNKQYTES